MTSNGVGTCGADDNQAQAGHLITTDTHTHTFQKVIRAGARDVNGDLPPEVWAEREVAATLNLHDLGSDTRAVEVIVQPLALRGRDGGAQLEVGDEGAPYNSLRAGDSGSSRGQLVAVTTLGDHTHALTAEGADASEDGTGRGTPIIAATLTAGTSRPGVNPPGRRQEDDENIIAFHLTQDPISGGVAPSLGAKSGGQGVATPTAVDLRNAARETGTGAGTQGTGITEGGPSYTVSATQRAVPGVATETTVRRLTPLECERLQGFPDNWTDGQADTHRYRQMGNAVAVPVFAWVACRLVTVDNEIRKGAL